MTRHAAGGPPVGLTEEQRRRYSRHLSIPELGEEGQAKLAAASVLVVGLGGLGSPAACTSPRPAWAVSALSTPTSSRPRTCSARCCTSRATSDGRRPRARRRSWPRSTPRSSSCRTGSLLARDCAGLIDAYDVVVTAVDNFPTRFLLNDVCVLHGRTLVEAAILRFTGLAMTIRGGESACYRCVFPEVPSGEPWSRPRPASSVRWPVSWAASRRARS